MNADDRLSDSINKLTDRATKAEAALDAIAEILSEKEWSSDTAPAIAGVVAATGREIKDLE